MARHTGKAMTGSTGEGAAGSPAIMEVRDVVKRFGGLRALDRVSLSLGAGEVLGLVGPNGAGKSVLQDCIGGSLVPDSGDIRIGGVSTCGWPPERLCHHGVSRTFQIPRLFQLMTAYETVLVAARFGPGNRAHRLRANELAKEALHLVGFNKPCDTPVSALNVTERKRLDLARSLACQPRLLMIDEVAAGLISSQAMELFGIVRRIAEHGIGVLIVEHMVSSIVTICDRFVVLEQGRVIADGPPDRVVADPGVIEAYFGLRTTIGA